MTCEGTVRLRERIVGSRKTRQFRLPTSHFPLLLTLFLLTGLIPQLPAQEQQGEGLLPGWLGGKSAHQLLRKGDDHYQEQEYSSAEIDYRKALEKKKSTQGTYNLGNAIYRQNRYEEAVRQFESAAAQAGDETTRAYAYHNLGNAYYHMQEYDKSIDAYKNALRLYPQDMQTKYNLALAQRQKRLQEQREQQQPQNQGEDPQKQDQQQNEQQQNQDQQQQQQQQDQQQQNPGQPNEEEQSSQTQPQPRDLTREEAQKLLEIMEREERKVQEKLRKAGAKPSKSAKDW